MNRILLLLVLLLISYNLTTAQALNSPESIKYDASRGRYIVSNTSGNNLLSVVPGQAPTIFKSGVSAPYGNTILGDTVFVCSSGTIKGYNLSNASQVYNLAISGASFLNGICSDNSGSLYVSDFSAKKIYRINIATQQYSTFVTTTGLSSKTPNGLAFDSTHNRLVVATWGTNSSVLGVNLADSTVTTLKTTTYGNNDGIAIDQDGNVYASYWSNQSLVFFDADFANAPLIVATGLSSPADICYNRFTDTVAIPNTGNSTIRYVGFPRPRAVSDTTSLCTDSLKTVCVTINDIDPVGQGLIIRSVSQASFGTATLLQNCVEYTAESEGSDTITYTVCLNDTPSFCRTGKLVVTNQVCSITTGLEKTAQDVYHSVHFFNGGLLLNWEAGNSGTTTIALFDLAGRSVYTENVEQKKGYNILQTNAGNPTKGMYILTMKSSSGSYTTKLTVD